MVESMQNHWIPPMAITTDFALTNKMNCGKIAKLGTFGVPTEPRMASLCQKGNPREVSSMALTFHFCDCTSPA